jgi:hypothetical protein
MGKRKALASDGQKRGDCMRACSKGQPDGCHLVSPEAGNDAGLKTPPEAWAGPSKVQNYGNDGCTTTVPDAALARAELEGQSCEHFPTETTPPEAQQAVAMLPGLLDTSLFSNPLQELASYAGVADMTSTDMPVDAARVAMGEIHPKQLVEVPASPMKAALSTRRRRSG